MSKLKILIVDDHPIVAEGLRTLVNGSADMRVLHCVSRAEDVLAAVRSKQPDVVLLDIKLKGRDGIEICRDLKAAERVPVVVLLSAFWDSRLVQRAFEAGADGYLLKDAASDHLLDAIRDAGAGLPVFDPLVAAELVRQARGVRAEPSLTDRDRRILELVAQGYANKEIALFMHLSPHTVRDRLSEVMLILAAKNRTEAVQIAQRDGLM